MIKKVCLVLLIAVAAGIQLAFAQQGESGTKVVDLELISDDELTQSLDKASEIELINKEDAIKENADTEQEEAVAAENAVSEQEKPDEIQYNEYLLQSQNLAQHAEESFTEGDYDASARYADDAALFAVKSDVYVAIDTAKRYLDQAVSSGVSVQFAPEYREADSWYQRSISARDSEEWDIAIDTANMVVELLEGLEASDGPLPLPAAYTVRPWSVSKDCFWNIAGFSWAYGNPRQWRLLYNANKSKLPNPNNPNVLEPGTVLDIPSIKGEVRRGAWESGKTYTKSK